MNHAVRVVVLSGLIALLPAFLVGMLLYDVPATRPLLEQRVCGAGFDLTQRITVTNLTSRRVSFHCRDAAGRIAPETVGFAVVGQAMRLAWPPITAAIGLTWWSVAWLRRRRGPGLETTAPVVEHSTVTLSRDELGPEAGAIVDRMVSGGTPSGRDVSALLGALARDGVPVDAASADRPDAETALRELQRLFDAGLVTREEYEARRTAILERAFG